MAVSESVDSSPPTDVTEGPPAASERRWYRRRKALGGLAALLAVAVAVPVGVQLGGGEKPKEKASGGASGPVAAPQARKLAAETGKDVEVTAERSANATTWAQPDGLFKKQISSSAVRAKVGDEWKAIDTDLEQTSGGFAAKAVNGSVVFSAGTPGAERSSRGVVRSALTVDVPGQVWTELVRLNVDGHDMSVSWPGVLPAPVIDGPRALYENVRPGIDLLMTAQDSGYSHLLVVKDKQAAADPLLAEINYRLASPDLQFQLDAESGSLSARDAKGEEVAGSPSPLMWDSSGKVATTDDVPAWKA
ncbi:hypothetical protein ACFWWM_41590, partial [Streptomyces sp. NPDC058682]